MNLGNCCMYVRMYVIANIGFAICHNNVKVWLVLLARGENIVGNLAIHDEHLKVAFYILKLLFMVLICSSIT